MRKHRQDVHPSTTAAKQDGDDHVAPRTVDDGRPPVAGMSIPETARFLGIGRSLTYEEIKAGKLRARKIRRRTVITRADALIYLNSRPLVDGSR